MGSFSREWARSLENGRSALIWCNFESNNTLRRRTRRQGGLGVLPRRTRRQGGPGAVLRRSLFRRRRNPRRRRMGLRRRESSLTPSLPGQHAGSAWAARRVLLCGVLRSFGVVLLCLASIWGCFAASCIHLGSFCCVLHYFSGHFAAFCIIFWTV